METSQLGTCLREISPHPYFSYENIFNSYEQVDCPGKWDLGRQLPRSRQPGKTEWRRATNFPI